MSHLKVSDCIQKISIIHFCAESILNHSEHVLLSTGTRFVVLSLKKLAGLAVLGAMFVHLTPLRAEAGTVKDCKVTFETVGKPVLVKIIGNSKVPCTGSFDVKGDSLVANQFKMNLTSLETGIELRNKHLRENYLHTEKFPEVTLTIKSASDLAKQLKGNAGVKSKFVSEMTIHGVSGTIDGGTYEIVDKKVKAEFRLELLDFKIDRPMFMGIKVVDAVIIRVEFMMGE